MAETLSFPLHHTKSTGANLQMQFYPHDKEWVSMMLYRNGFVPDKGCESYPLVKFQLSSPYCKAVQIFLDAECLRHIGCLLDEEKPLTVEELVMLAESAERRTQGSGVSYGME